MSDVISVGQTRDLPINFLQTGPHEQHLLNYALSDGNFNCDGQPMQCAGEVIRVLAVPLHKIA